MSPDALIMQQNVLQEVISNQCSGIRSDVSLYSKAVVSRIFWSIHTVSTHYFQFVAGYLPTSQQAVY